METELSGLLFKVHVREVWHNWKLSSPLWPTLRLEPLTCGVQINGLSQRPREVYAEKTSKGDALNLTWVFPEAQVHLIQRLIFSPDGWLFLRSELTNLSQEGLTLNNVTLLKLIGERQPVFGFGSNQEKSRVYEEGGYWARVRLLNERTQPASEKEPLLAEISGTSQHLWEIYNPTDQRALLVGYITFDRWLGRVKVTFNPNIGVTEWDLGFDGGDLLIDPGQTVHLEDVVFMTGGNPWLLLEEFGDLIKEKHCIKPLEKPPVSWCSWYPYRLGVTEEDILANAKVAAHRLKPYGFKNLQVDYGWEKGWLGSVYEEKEEFPHGLKWLSEEVGKMGFNLGVWKAPFSISEFDPVCREHPEWLLGDDKEKPKAKGTWFWEPHGYTYAMDLTHPGAQEYIREKVAGLALREVKYFKFDFIGDPCSPSLRNRYNPRMVAGGGVEAVRLGCRIVAEAVKAVNPRCIILNCNPYEVCGLGHFDLLYTCNDTGNTGYISWSFMRENYTTVACHLWKNHRWGIIQPSCLCVGLPGTLEEARMRATATFLSGGEVDIGDDLTTLPEDRWQVLQAILPLPEKSAKPIDLFEPILTDQRGSSVWYMPMENQWDKWTLLGLFAWEPSSHTPGKAGPITEFRIGWERLNLDPSKDYWIYEFWSGQFLGEIPGLYERSKSYTHGGDAQALIWGTRRGTLHVDFFGPAVKLLVIREARPHPWVVGTNFHASGGTELQNVKWDETCLKLSGELHRPPGNEGFIVVAGLHGKSAQATVATSPVSTVQSANASITIPVVTQRDVTPWTLKIA